LRIGRETTVIVRDMRTNGPLGATVITAIVLAACAGSDDAPAASGPVPDSVQAGAATGSVCQVEDTSDVIANRIASEGADRATDDFGLPIDVRRSTTDGDGAAEIQSFVDADCSLLTVVGVSLSKATADVARTHPDQQFATVDFELGEPIDNVMTLSLNAAEPAFLAGYLAAGMTESDVVATYGAINIAPVTALMDGFVNGVALYNDRTGSSVQAIGWDGADGLFVDNFDNEEDGRSLAASLAEEGVDVIFPVAGRVGLGSAAFARETDGMRIIGVDTDLHDSNVDDASVYLTSVIKHFDQAVYAAVERIVVNGEAGGSYVGTLENGGVGLAPYHNQAGDVPDALKQEIEAITAEIIAGDVRVT
jgi:basic membrane protein A